MRYTLLGVLVAATCAAHLGAQQSSRRQATPSATPPTRGLRAGPAEGYGPKDPESVDRGKKQFVATCGFCHGSGGTGAESGPDLIRSPLVLHDRQGDQISPVILQGRPDKGMPKFALSKEQIADISAFLHQRMEEISNRGAYKIQDVVTGDAKAGRQYFNGAGKCATCHSPTGDLAGIANKYDPVALQSRFLYPRARAFRGMRGGPAPPSSSPITVTVTESSGKSITGVMEHLDDFMVSLRDVDGEYHSWRRDLTAGLKVTLHDPLDAHWELLDRYTNADMHNILAYLETLK